jgi:endo-1,4-beta-xylanase
MRAESLRRLATKRGLLLGAAFSSNAFRSDPQYGKILAHEFNCLVGENNMKMNALQPLRGKFNFSRADTMLMFASRHNMKVRGVPLVWHISLPPWVKDKTFARKEALDILREHVLTVAGHFRGRVFAWDVVNEGLNDRGPGLMQKSVWYRSIGPDYIEKAYHWAHEADPDALLFYNDYNMDGTSPKTDRCYEWIKELLARKVPIHGIGLQYHTRVDAIVSSESIARNIRRFNDLGLAVHITELDVWVPAKATPEHFQLQATVYRDIIRTALAARDCPVVMLWGFTDRYSWVPWTSGGAYGQALIFDEDYRIKAAYEAIATALRET